MFLRDRDKLLGFGRIAETRTVEATKPFCGVQSVEPRRFIGAKTFIQHFTAASTKLSRKRRFAQRLRPLQQAALYSRSQSVWNCSPLKLRLPALKNLINQLVDSFRIRPEDAAEDHPDFNPQDSDGREHMLRTIKERRGQRSFRELNSQMTLLC